jgi:opacity protein-like surface antigen
MMKTKIVLSAVLVAIASAAHADEKRVELGINLGYTGSSGIDSNEVAPSGQAGVFVEVRPKSAFSWGVDLGYFASEKVQIGALFSSQKSDLQFTVGSTFNQVGEGLDVQNFMGTFAYHTGSFDSKTRLYLLGGLGATRYGEVTFVGVNGQTAQTSGKSKFATTWGVGLKSYPSEKIGFRLGVRWTPTNLGDTADEWVCSPYYPAECTVGENTQYAHQYEFTGALMIRF